jgi:hypothetical protein
VTNPLSGGCPHCGQIDQVQNVPAVVAGGHSTYRGASPMVGSAPGGVFVGYQQHGGVAVTETARGLNLVPPWPRTGCLIVGVVLLSLGTLGLTNLAGKASAPEDLDAARQAGTAAGRWLLPAMGLAITALLVWFLIRAMRTRSRIRRGMPAALAVWNSGWFCHRCGGVFFPAGTPHDVPTARLLSSREFQGIVHHAGRFHP